MDLQISRWILETFGESRFVAILAKLITFCGSAWTLIAVVLLLVIFKKTRKIGIYALFAVGAVYIFNDLILKNIVARPRPFITDESLKAMCELAQYEFPSGFSMASGHSATSMALAFSIFLQSKKIGIPAIIVSVLIGLSRIVLCVHYLTDVLVGFGLGILFAVAVYFVMEQIYKIYKKRRVNNEKNSAGDNK